MSERLKSSREASGAPEGREDIFLKLMERVPHDTERVFDEILRGVVESDFEEVK